MTNTEMLVNALRSGVYTHGIVLEAANLLAKQEGMVLVPEVKLTEEERVEIDLLIGMLDNPYDDILYKLIAWYDSQRFEITTAKEKQ